MQDLADDKHVRILNEKIQAERDPKKLLTLIDELMRLLDDRSHFRLTTYSKGTAGNLPGKKAT